MKPIFFDFELPLVGQVTFPAYLTMIMVGFIAAVLLARRDAERVGIHGNHIIDLGLLLLVAAIGGARLLSVLTDGYFMDFVHLCTDPELVSAPDAAVGFCQTDADCGFDYLCNVDARDAVIAGERDTMCYPPRDCLAVFKFWQGGLTFYGGVLVAVPLGIWYARRKGLGGLRVADITAPAIMLGLAIGRLGCFFNGCCYGAPTSTGLGVDFPGHALPRHPAQIYESLVALGLFLLLYFLVRPRKRGDGEVLGWMLILYGAARILLEIVRDDVRGGLGPLSTSQWLSIPLIAVGALLVWRAHHPAPGAATASGD